MLTDAHTRIGRSPAPGHAPFFSILIPTWNNLPYLKLCIRSIRQHSALPFQIVVHINEGTDGTLEWIEQQRDIAYSISDTNIGVCYALNFCRQLATADYLLYLNDDMYTCPGWDSALITEVHNIGHPFFFLSATMIEPVTQNPCCIEMNCGQTLETFDEKKLLEHGNTVEKNDWQGSTWPPNLVHKDIWDLAGGYSTEFSPGMNSDPDFSMKLWQMGIRLFKGIGASRVYHFGSVSVRRINKNKGYFTFVSKWGLTQSAFQLGYLRRGEKFDGPLREPQVTTAVKMKNIFKQIKAAFNR